MKGADTELKPCPFCGEVENLQTVVSPAHHPSPGVEGGWVECRNCGARGQTQYGSCMPDEMIALVHYGWNDRRDRQTKQ